MAGRMLKIPKGILEELYIKQRMTATQVGETLGIHRQTACRHLRKYGLLRSKAEIVTLQMSTRRKLPEPEEVDRLYWNERLTIAHIAQIFNVTNAAVRTYMQRHNIPRRALHGGEDGAFRDRPNSHLIGRHPSEEVLRKAAEANRGRTPWWIERGLPNPGIYFTKPTKPERILIGLIKANNLPYKYVGDGQFILGGNCPDFININGKKQIIEVFGTYWHDIFDVARKKEHYRQYGFDTLIIWENEFKNEKATLKKVQSFTRKKVRVTP